jgi:hypothetical protein
LISPDAYTFSDAGYLLVVGFEEEYLVTALAFPLTGTSSPLRRHLMTISRSYRHLDTIKCCHVTSDGRLKALITEDSGDGFRTDGPQSIIASFALAYQWEDPGPLVTPRLRHSGPYIERTLPLCSLRTSPNTQRPTQTNRADANSERYWRCRHWSIVDMHGNLLLKREYRWS